MLETRDYQQQALDALSKYFTECSRTDNANTAFYTTTLNTFGVGIPYTRVEALGDLPYVCVRIPTGGGKTFVACNAVAIAARDLLHADKPVVLWLVPSNTILEQTLNALRNPKHDYRKALASTLGTVNILDVVESLSITKASLDSAATIIVSTMQSFRVEDTVGRRVYKNSGDLMGHFDAVPADVLQKLERTDSGVVKKNLANVLCLRRPIVIVDEAHNARTELSFETLKRFDPSCIMEFSATPDREKNPSNILHSASAAELKAAQMIKMPIRLETRTDWKELLSDAIACRNNLEHIANMEQQSTGEYIRPIMLVQAQAQYKNKETITVKVVKACLLKDHNIPEETIAVATGEEKELDDVEDILSPKCPIRYVITMQALREGWDCPFAYILCSVAEVQSGTYVEQILGRIMRLPKVKWKQHVELNNAYAFCTSAHFYNAANMLTDALVQNGFERQEAKDLIVAGTQVQAQLFDEGGLFTGQLPVSLPELPSTLTLSPATKARIILDKEAGTLTYKGVMSKDDRAELKACFTTQEGKNCIEYIYRVTNSLPIEGKDTPSERGVAFAVPVLAIKQGSLFEQFEDTHFLDREWSLSRCDARLSEVEYSGKRVGAQRGEISVTEKGRLETHFISSLQDQMTLFADAELGVADLVHWLDRKILHRDITLTESGIFLTQLIQTLIDERNFSIAQLAQDKYTLLQAVSSKIEKHREEARRASYQMLLDPSCATPLVVTPERCFSYDFRQYPYNTLCKTGYQWRKHYYPEVGNLRPEGEEFECAQYIDQMDEVEFWVRNIERQPSYSFWLQTSKYRFYPDFVCKLLDGRFLLVEYKGAYLYKDAEEKRTLGELWAKRSDGKCLFVMPKEKNFDLIRAIACGGKG